MVESFAFNKDKWTGLDIDVSISFLCLFTGPILVSKETDPAYSFPAPWIVFPRSEIPQNNFERFFKP